MSGKKFRLRDLFIKFPFLDRLRIHTIIWFFKHGIGLLDRSYRVIALIPPDAKPFVKSIHSRGSKPATSLDFSQKPCIFAFFHGHMHALLALEPRANMTVLVSNSRDGEMIARAALEMKFDIVRGSRTHGGVKGALDVLDQAGKGQSILFNVDGPRGPRHIVKDSIIRVAEMSGLPIVPVVAASRTQKEMRSWDRFVFPYLNTETLLIFGNPLSVERPCQKESREKLREVLEKSMISLTESASSYYSQSDIQY